MANGRVLWPRLMALVHGRGHEEGCPAKLVGCKLLSVACSARFGDIWIQDPPRGFEILRIEEVCQVSCGRCGLPRYGLVEYDNAQLASWPLEPAFIFAMESPRAFHVAAASPLQPSMRLSKLLLPFSGRRWQSPYAVFRRDDLALRLELELLPSSALGAYARLLAGCPPLSVRRLCASWSSFTAHVYISTNESAGAAHHDLGDVLVLQLLGEKTWSFAPTPGRHKSEQVTLDPGAALWLPAGCHHRAAATGVVPSVHITLELGPFEPIPLNSPPGVDEGRAQSQPHADSCSQDDEPFGSVRLELQSGCRV